MDNDYVLLDTAAFDAAISQKDRFIREYNALNEDYGKIVRALLDNWKGSGANAFVTTAEDIRHNISGIEEILKIMMETLEGCKAAFEETDDMLGDYNRDPQ